MAMRMLLGVLTGALFAMTQALSGQNAPEPSVRTKSVELTPLVSVEITVLSSGRDLLVPYCGDGEGRTESLCILPAYWEVRTNQG
jgi:hypothetical protein